MEFKMCRAVGRSETSWNPASENDSFGDHHKMCFSGRTPEEGCHSQCRKNKLRTERSGGQHSSLRTSSMGDNRIRARPEPESALWGPPWCREARQDYFHATLDPKRASWGSVYIMAHFSGKDSLLLCILWQKRTPFSTGVSLETNGAIQIKPGRVVANNREE